MKLKKIACGLLCAALMATAGCGGSDKPAADSSKAYLQLKDDAGRQVTLLQKPERVVSLSPSYLSMIDAVGGKIVGRATSKVGTVPESMKSVPEIGLVFNINMENLIGLKGFCSTSVSMLYGVLSLLPFSAAAATFLKPSKSLTQPAMLCEPSTVTALAVACIITTFLLSS